MRNLSLWGGRAVEALGSEGGRDDASRGASANWRAMHDLIEEFPAQVETAWNMALDWPLPLTLRTPRQVLVLGVGGSAIGGDLSAALARRSPTVVRVVRGYDGPPALDDTLVIACSFSGETIETLQAFACYSGGPAARMAVTTGGALAQAAREHNVPLFGYTFDGPPRAALAFGLMPLLSVLARLGVVELAESQVATAIAELEAAAAAWAVQGEGEHLGAGMARELEGMLPVVLGPGVLAPAARRWATQLNENAQQWAFGSELPEFDHNLIVGIARREPRIAVVLLDSPLLDARDRRYVRITEELLDEAGVTHRRVQFAATSELSLVLQACHLGDWTSLELAKRLSVDPFDTHPLVEFKARLRASS